MATPGPPRPPTAVPNVAARPATPAPTPAPAFTPGQGIVRTLKGLTTIIGDFTKIELMALADLQEVSRIRQLPILHPPMVEMAGTREKTRSYVVLDTEAKIAYVVWEKET